MNNYRYSNMNMRNIGGYGNPQNNRFVGGGFLGPFILGGITGGLLAPAFYPNPRPYPYPPYQQYSTTYQVYPTNYQMYPYGY